MNEDQIEAKWDEIMGFLRGTLSFEAYEALCDEEIPSMIGGILYEYEFKEEE